jgi:hypothetical protein
LVAFAELVAFAAGFFAAGLAAVFFLVAIVLVLSGCMPQPFLVAGKRFLSPWSGRGRLSGAAWLSMGQLQRMGVFCRVKKSRTTG